MESIALLFFFKKGIPLAQLSLVFGVRSSKSVLSVFTKVMAIKYYYRAIRNRATGRFGSQSLVHCCSDSAAVVLRN